MTTTKLTAEQANLLRDIIRLGQEALTRDNLDTGPGGELGLDELVTFRDFLAYCAGAPTDGYQADRIAVQRVLQGGEPQTFRKLVASTGISKDRLDVVLSQLVKDETSEVYLDRRGRYRVR